MKRTRSAKNNPISSDKGSAAEMMETENDENKLFDGEKKVLLNEFHSAEQNELNRHVIIHKIHKDTTTNEIRALLKARDIQFAKLYVKQRENGSQYAFITLRGGQFAYEACEKFNVNAPTVNEVQLKLSIAKTRTKNSKGKQIQFGSVEFKVDNATVEAVKVVVGGYDGNLGFTVLPELTKWKANPNIEVWDWAYDAPYVYDGIVKFDKKRPEEDELYLLNDFTGVGPLGPELTNIVVRVKCVKSTPKHVIFRDLDSGYEHNIENYRGDKYPLRKWAKYEYWYRDKVVPTGAKVKLFGVEKSFSADKRALDQEFKKIENRVLKMLCYGVDKDGLLHVDFELKDGSLLLQGLVKRGLLEVVENASDVLEPCADKLDGVYREEQFAIFNQAGFSPGDIISGRIVHIDASDIKSIYIQTDEPKILKRLTDELQVNITYGKEFLESSEKLEEGDVCLFIAKSANGRPRAMRGEIQERTETYFSVEAIDHGFSMNVKHKNCYILPKEFKVVERQAQNVILAGVQMEGDSNEAKEVLNAIKSEKTLLDFQFLTEKEVFCPMLQEKMILNGVKPSFLPVNR